MKKEYDFSRAKRARFRGLPPIGEIDRHTKVRITIMLDHDVLKFFKQKAARRGAEPYQTQINRVLREYITSGGGGGDKEDRLLKDKGFISKLAEQVAAYSAGPRGRALASRTKRG